MGREICTIGIITYFDAVPDTTYQGLFDQIQKKVIFGVLTPGADA